MPNEDSKSPATAPTTAAPAPASATPPTATPAKKTNRLRLIGAVVAALLLIVGVPRIFHAINTVSTDDAYVNSYVTFVAPRVSGQVLRVLVDDNNRVRKGDLLVELDPEPFQVQVAVKQAALDSAKANMLVAEANVRGLIARRPTVLMSLLRPST